jgi:hypothetical protein
LNAAYQIYQVIFKHSIAGWVIPIQVCLGVECVDSWSLYADNLLTVFLFSSKYAISLIRNPEALIVLKSAVLRENRDEVASTFTVSALYTLLVKTCCPTAAVSVDAMVAGAVSMGDHVQPELVVSLLCHVGLNNLASLCMHSHTF